MKGHVALVAIAKIWTHVRRPLIGFSKNEAIRIACVNFRT